MGCDICGKSEQQLQSLYAQYQTKDIKDMCSECTIKVNDHLWKLRSMSNKMNSNFLKEFIKNLNRKLWHKGNDVFNPGGGK